MVTLVCVCGRPCCPFLLPSLSSTFININSFVMWALLFASNLCLLSLTKWSHMLLIWHWSHVVTSTNSGQLQEMRHISPLLHYESHGLHIAQWNVMPDCRHPHICFLEQRRGSLQRGMCACMRRGFETGLAGVVYFQRGVLRMCWEVEELRELSALWFGFHLPGTLPGVWG